MNREAMSGNRAADEYYVNSPLLRRFIDDVVAAMDAEPDRAVLVERIKPSFGLLLAANGWLPRAFQRVDDASGMGGGIGQYLLYRKADRSLTLSVLVVSPGLSTPVHDHLSWGLVGLYRGGQREEVYAARDEDIDRGVATLELKEERTLRPGEFYSLLPPDNDVHRVTTISDVPSISIHLLGNDVGCVVRHRFDLETSAVHAFRSGYGNVPCPEPDPK
jgi:predicted metal-dependent enzyme (double-stranded beta helix superfamily)